MSSNRRALLSVCLLSYVSVLIGGAPLGPSTLGVLAGSGVGYPSEKAEGFGNWLGYQPAKANTCFDFTHFTYWPSYFIEPFNANSTNSQITLQVPIMFPPSTAAGATPTNWSAGAAGLYNDQFYHAGVQMVSVQNKSDIIFRIGWEMNGNWYPWNASSNLTDYLAYYRQVVQTLKSVPGNNFTFIWNPAAGFQYGTDSLNPPWAAYPGDDVTDYIGIDLYDSDWSTYSTSTWQDGLTPEQINATWWSQWNKYKTGTYNLDQMFNFSRSKNKKFAICEWGLAPPSDHGGGDNVVYIQQMYNWMTQPSVYPYLLYHAYYDAQDSIISGPPLSPVNTNFPNSSALYKSLFGPTNPFWATTMTTSSSSSTSPSTSSSTSSTSSSTSSTTASSTAIHSNSAPIMCPLSFTLYSVLFSLYLLV